MHAYGDTSVWHRVSRDEALAALGLDVSFRRAEGSRLIDEGGRVVWDFLGGYGSTIFGHNHPTLKAALLRFVEGDGAVHVQASLEAEAAELRANLAQRLEAAVGRAYQVVLGSTGAEAVEIAARHAQLAYERRREKIAEGIRLPPGSAVEWTTESRALLDRVGLRGDVGSAATIAEHNRRVLDTPGVWLAVERGFHGKTARALALTHDPDGRFGPRPYDDVRFIPPDAAALPRLLEDLTLPLLTARVEGERWALRRVDWTPVLAFFMEPIQGEGGIHPIVPECAQVWHDACAVHAVPLVADEIQSGMGRTGSFLYSEQLGIAPDTVLLGKSLGGGMVKASAAAFASDGYDRSFSLMHSSTFAGDGLACHVARKALRLMDEEDAPGTARSQGEELLRRLTELAGRYPDVIAEVRGRGLMIGVQWRRMPFERSPALRYLDRYGWLGYAAAGYLLRAHDLRVAPTLSRADTLRLEPAYGVPAEAINALLSGLERLCALLRAEAGGEILGPCMGLLPVQPSTPAGPPAVLRGSGALEHVAFVGHFIDGDGVGLWDRSFRSFGTAGGEAFLERLRPFAEPLVCHRDRVGSICGEEIALTFIGVPISSDQFARALRSPDRHELRDLVGRAVSMARAEGCAAVGLGGYTSILTRNGKDVAERGLAVTTGNGFTVGATLLAIEAAARQHGIPWPGARVAVVGARGNIGGVLARVLAPHAGSLVLVGRENHRRDVETLAGDIVAELLADAPGSAIIRALRAAGTVNGVTSSRASGAAIHREVIAPLRTDSPLQVAADVAACAGADLVVTASNSVRPLILPEHVSPDPTVIVDLAVPGDVDPAVRVRRPEAVVIRGGVVCTPLNPDWHVPGIPLPPGEMFACMAETVLMGLERQRSHGSLGPLSVEWVRETLRRARRHGFASVRVLDEGPAQPATDFAYST